MGINAVSTKSDIAIRGQRGELERQELIVADGLRTFVDVGRALAKIRDGRLYRESGFDTFETYCRKRWEMGKSHAYRLIDASALASALSPIGDKNKPLESQVRPLLKLPEDDRAKVWEMAVQTAPDGNVTAKHVARLVDEHIGGNDPSHDPNGEDHRTTRKADGMTQEELTALKKKVVELASGGMRISDIESTTGLTRNTIDDWLEDPDSAPSTRGYNGGRRKFQDSDVRRLFEDGKSLSEIADELECGVKTVGAYLKRMGLSRAGKRAQNLLHDHVSRAESQAEAWEIGADTISAAASVSSSAQIKQLIMALARLSKAAANLKNRLNKDAGKEE